MQITDVPTLWGNVIGLVAVSWKTFYDLYWNPRKFEKEVAKGNSLKAAEDKRKRADFTTAITFLLVGVGYAFTIAALIRWP